MAIRCSHAGLVQLPVYTRPVCTRVMTFNTRHSSFVEQLSARLMAELAAAPLPDPLAPEYVLVDNRVLGDWLNLQIAQQQGIAANIRYIQPHELFWLLARCLVSASLPQQTPLSKTEMTWKLYGLLDEQNPSGQALLAQSPVAPVRAYLAGDERRDLKRYQLAGSVADLFDQYMIYRPDWILKWQEGKAVLDADDNEQWQALLFQSLGGERVQAWPHRAAIEKKLLQRLATENIASLQEQIPFTRLSVFGITSMPPMLVQLLACLGRSVDVHTYVLNPCQEYWSLISSARELAKKMQLAKKEAHSEFAEDQHYEIGNPLLASQGVQVRDFIALLQNAGDTDPEFLSPEFLSADDENKDDSNLLEAIQREIRELRYKGESAQSDYISQGRKQAVPDNPVTADKTIPAIHIHNCHSVMREVEVLHDQLRDILACNPDLATRDIVVMMPRVAPYVASIHAVFNSGDEAQRLDYHISDRSALEESPLLHSLLSLLKLPESRLPLSEILALLEVPALQRRFAIDADSYSVIKQWLVESGMRWGIDAAHRQSLGLPAYAEASWEFAFNRLMAGYAMTDAVVTLATAGQDQPIQAYDLIEGSNSAAFDSLLQFWQSLLAWRKTLTSDATPQAWAERLRTMLAHFFDVAEEQEVLAIKAAHKSIAVLDDVETQQWFSGPLSLEVIRELLQPTLAQQASAHNHWREGIKFCSLMPMRGVPFKVIYVMGMNMDDYPRRIEKRSFDLMRYQYRPGDRASRVDDRWLFLEALLSARRYFHVSYIGRDMYRNEKREPSVVLSELMDYCHHGYELQANDLLTEHPLQPFSEQYFRRDKSGLSSRLVSFNSEAWHIAQAKTSLLITDNSIDSGADQRWQTAEPKRSGQESSEVDTVALNDFIQFFTKPAAWFFGRKHRVWLDVEEETVNDDENFGDFSGIDKWNLRAELIRTANAQSQQPTDLVAARDLQVDALVASRRAQGHWPLGLAGDIEKTQLASAVDADYLWASYGCQMLSERIRIGSGANSLWIDAEFPVLADGSLLIHSASSYGDDKKLDFYIRTALLKKVQRPDFVFSKAQACFYKSRSSVRDEILAVDIFDQHNDQFLSLLAELYWRYQSCGLPFEAELSRVLANTDSEEDRKEIIEDAWYKNSPWSKGFASDSKKRSYYGSAAALSSASFYAISKSIWSVIDTWYETTAAQQKAAKAAKGKKS